MKGYYSIWHLRITTVCVYFMSCKMIHTLCMYSIWENLNHVKAKDVLDAMLARVGTTLQI